MIIKISRGQKEQIISSLRFELDCMAMAQVEEEYIVPIKKIGALIKYLENPKKLKRHFCWNCGTRKLEKFMYQTTMKRHPWQCKGVCSENKNIRIASK
jgi:hypothetical protein